MTENSPSEEITQGTLDLVETSQTEPETVLDVAILTRQRGNTLYFDVGARGNDKTQVKEAMDSAVGGITDQLENPDLLEEPQVSELVDGVYQATLRIQTQIEE